MVEWIKRRRAKRTKNVLQYPMCYSEVIRFSGQ